MRKDWKRPKSCTSPTVRRKFLEGIREHHMTLRTAAAYAGVSPDGIGDYYRTGGAHHDPEFAAQVELARADSQGFLERRAGERAVEGFRRKVVTKSGEVVEIHDAPSDKLLEMLLRARDPEAYASHSKIQHSGQLTLSDAAEGELSAMTLPELDRLAAMVERARQMILERDPALAEQRRRDRLAELREALGQRDDGSTPAAAKFRITQQLTHAAAAIDVDPEAHA
jgi:hypothetical protein